MRLREICLTLWLAAGAAQSHGAETLIVDERHKDGCGPISCLVALRSLGFDASLKQLCEECRWRQGEPVRLGDMEQALDSHHGIECIPVQLTPRQLVDCLRDRQTVVILALAKKSKTVNHAVCAVGVNDSDEVTLIDYPELAQIKTLGEITSEWDGAALVVRPSPVSRALEKMLLYVVPCLAVMIVISALRFRRMAKKK